MGVNIYLKVFDIPKLLNQMEEFVEEKGGVREGAFPPREFFSNVADKFGVTADGKFFVVWNEYYEGYNPASEFMRVVEKYYFPNNEDVYFYADGHGFASEGVNADEVLDNLVGL